MVRGLGKIWLRYRERRHLKNELGCWWHLILANKEDDWYRDLLEQDLARLSLGQREFLRQSIGLHPCSFLLYRGLRGEAVARLGARLELVLHESGRELFIPDMIIDAVLDLYDADEWQRQIEEARQLSQARQLAALEQANHKGGERIMQSAGIIPEVLNSELFRLTLAWQRQGCCLEGRPVSQGEYLEQRGLSLAELNGQMEEALHLSRLYLGAEAWYKRDHQADVFTYLRERGLSVPNEGVVKGMLVLIMNLA